MPENSARKPPSTGPSLNEISDAPAEGPESDRWSDAVRTRLAFAGLPASVFERREFLYDGELETVKRAVEAFVAGGESNRPWLILTGAVGCGKTQLVGRVVAEWIRRGGHARYGTVSDLLLRIRDSFRDGANVSELSIIRPFQETGLAILDDVGTERATEFTANVIFTVLDARYQRAARTILISNYSPGQLAARLAVGDDRALTADRVTDRILELSTWLELPGKSLRPHVAQLDRDFNFDAPEPPHWDGESDCDSEGRLMRMVL